MSGHEITRRSFGVGVAATLTAPAALAQGAAASIIRTVPSSGERLPAVGLGTAQVFATDDEKTRTTAQQVVGALVAGGGRLIDTASSYGDAESVVGAAIATLGLRDKVFIATKLRAPDQRELDRSLTRLKVRSVDLLQLHNVRDAQQSLAAFKAWKAQGVCRHIGVTSTSHGDFAAVAAVIERERPDFVQVDYSVDDRAAEARVLPAAAANKVAVLTALPFGRNRLFRAVRDKGLPDWAAPFAASWAQFFLKFLIADPRVTAVIPGTSDAAHMTDNLGAMRGPLPDPDQRKRMIALIESL